MRFLVTEQGVYGQRIAQHLQETAPEGWEIFTWHLPKISLQVIDEPEEFVPSDLPQVDLILHAAETPQAAELLTAVVAITGAQGVVAAVDHAHWIPHGLRGQLEKDLAKKGVEIVFPEPLCSLTESTYGYGHKSRSYESAIISSFTQHYGWPRLEVEVDVSGKIVATRILREAPCGATRYTCGRVMGMKADSATPSAGLLNIHFPCLASMQFEYTDEGIDTIMHTGGKVFNEALDSALAKVSSK
ncbi:MAG: DUF166 family protein [Thermincolia bacterium]